jgi:hypothetical protein
MADSASLHTFDVRDLLWRIVVTVLLLLILAGPGARSLRREAHHERDFFVTGTVLR